jgi:hypothetical protein
VCLTDHPCVCLTLTHCGESCVRLSPPPIEHRYCWATLVYAYVFSLSLVCVMAFCMVGVCVFVTGACAATHKVYRHPTQQPPGCLCSQGCLQSVCVSLGPELGVWAGGVTPRKLLGWVSWCAGACREDVGDDPQPQGGICLCGSACVWRPVVHYYTISQ